MLLFKATMYLTGFFFVCFYLFSRLTAPVSSTPFSSTPVLSTPAVVCVFYVSHCQYFYGTRISYTKKINTLN